MAYRLSMRGRAPQAAHVPESNFGTHSRPAREIVQRFERGAHGAVMIDPRAERARSPHYR
jgi:hypothetical protein